MKVLVTGGTGFIGSHTCVELLKSGYEVVIADDLSNSKREVCDKIESITGKKVVFYEANVCDSDAMETIFSEHQIDAAIHFAGFKAVGESVAQPLRYYHNNLLSTFVLCETMKRHGCDKIVFSSSATVYGVPERIPCREDASLSATNPYGATKLFIERILQDAAFADQTLRVALLRYFNPIGAHESGLLGENPNGIPNNLMPYIAMVAAGKLEKVHVFGDDYATPDGTGVRDYIHVVDLARGHVKAIEYLMGHTGAEVFNLGTGIGYSVLDIINTFSKVNKIEIPYVIEGRRPGDVAENYADVTKSRELLHWQAEYDLARMCEDSWRFAKNNF